MDNRLSLAGTGTETKPTRKIFSDYEKGWISALIDSEGCLTWRKGFGLSPYVEIVNTDLSFLVHAQNLLGGKIYDKWGKAHWHTGWTLMIPFKDWKLWLNDIPLNIKENKRQEFLRYQLDK